MADNLNATKHRVHLFWSDDDGGFIATSPDLPGCIAFGEDRAEAIREMEFAILVWIEAAREAGNPIPAASTAGGST